MTRRNWIHLLLATPPQPELLRLKRNGAMPNNERLAVLLYRNILPSTDRTNRMEALFAANGWKPSWRNGVYPFHHFHTTAHEALGFAAGEAKLLLGGPLPGGREILVQGGDVALLPCGTGHFRISASRDFLVVGAYALEQTADLWREAPDAAAKQRMRDLPFPDQDPVGNRLRNFWNS
jgi:uncharacterized protein YjlB